MQPTVEDETEQSVLGPTPGLDRKENASKSRKPAAAASSPVTANRSKPRRGNVTTLLETLKTAQNHETEPADAPAEAPTQKSAPYKQRFPPAAANPAPARMNRRQDLSHMSIGTPNHTARSFFLPNLAHMNDFISGTLRLSSMKNGMPVFVKHGKVHDRESKKSPDHHAEIEDIAVPEDEEKIFVSLDKIREEIQALKEHDDMVSQQAEHLQQEVVELQVQVAKYKSRKDSAMGSDSESSVVDHLNAQKSQLEDQVASLQSRLDKANRKISINEIHTESYITERDEALKSATDHLEKIKRLQSELSAVRDQLEEFQEGNTRDLRNVELENGSLRTDNNALRSQHKSLLEENQSLRAHNEAMSQQQSRLQQELKEVREQLRSTQKDLETVNKEYKSTLEENAMLQQDNMSLERHNDKYFNDNKALQQKHSLLERRVHDLQDDNANLNELLDAANAATGTMTVDAKDMKSRLETQNRKLSAETAKLQQEIIDLQADSASKGMIHDQEKRQLVAANARLQKQIEQIGVKFERIVQESKAQASKFEEKEFTMTQQIQELAERESALTGQLKESINLKTVDNNAKGKKSKTARIVEPVNTKETSRSVTSQTDMPIPDDYTRQIDLTQGSDGSNFAKSEISELREALLQARVGTQPQDVTDDTIGSDDDAGITEEASQSLPPPFVPRARAGSIKTRLPSGILKNAESSKTKANKAAKIARYEGEQDHSGRFSIKSGFSDMSLPTQTTQTEFARPRHNSDSARFELDTPEERNMTSALFMDDITLEGQKQAERQQAKKAVPSLSKDAKRVLDNLCRDHDCRNCIVCTRVVPHKHEDEAVTKSKKRTIRVERPVAPSERAAAQQQQQQQKQYEDQPTLRPARDPALALAVVIKGLRDEEAHLGAALLRAQAQYDALEASTGRRGLSAEIRRLMRQREVKRDQIYDLHDVLEGQRAGGLDMTAQDVEVTIASVLSRDETWNGIVD